MAAHNISRAVVNLKVETTTVLFGEMRVALVAGFERGQTQPADVRSAPATSHVVTAINLLHRSLALWAILDPKSLLGLSECFEIPGSVVLVLSARHAWVRNMAASADGNEATVASEGSRSGTFGGRPIDLVAVWRGARSKLCRVLSKMRGE
jgi:hypothetical protein